MKRKKQTLLLGIAYTLACVFTFLVGSTAFAEQAPQVESETYLTLNSDLLKVQADTKGGFVKAEWNGNDIQLYSISSKGQLSTRVLSTQEKLSSLRGFKQTEDGGYLLAVSLAKDSANQLYIFKIDKDGGTVWKHATNQMAYYTPAYFQETKDGGIVLAATIHSSQPVSGSPSQEDDIYLLKLDSDGNKLWEHVIGGPSSYLVNALRETGDGGVVLTGERLAGSGKINRDLYAAKFDAAGNLVWERKQDTGGDTIGNDIIETRDGGVVIAGYTGEPNYYGSLLGSGYLLKLDTKGMPVWEKKLPASLGRSNVNEIQEDSDGNLILAATVNYNIINQGTHEADGYLLKMDPNGNPIWDKVLESGGKAIYRNISNVQLTPDGGYLAIGKVEKTRGISTEMILTKLTGEKKPTPSTLSLDKGEYSLTVGQSVYSVLTSVYGGQATDVTRYSTYKIDNPAVASVDLSGQITGLQSGDTVLTAVYGGKSASAKVHVKSPMNSSILFDSEDYSVIVGQTLDAHLYLVNGNKRTEVTSEAQYEFSDPTIASIDKAGNFAGLKYGVTELTATYRGMKVTSKIYVY